MEDAVLHHFIALMCPTSLANAVDIWTATSLAGARRVKPEKLHLTLTFPGRLEDRALAAVQSVAARLDAPAFELRLDRLGRWRGGLVYLAPSSAGALMALADQLATSLREVDISLDERHFVPHVTLARAFFDELPASRCFE